MMKSELISLDYCALSYLNQWQKDDSMLYSLLNSNEVECQKEGIERAVTFYGIARNFPKKYDSSDRFDKVLNRLSNINVKVTLSNFIEIVNDLADNFLEDYKQRNISAASKLLWLRHRDPVIIYDKRAIDGLKSRFQYKGEYGDYVNFSRTWLQEYENKSQEITVATQKLLSVKQFTYNHLASSEEIKNLTKENWFKMRVFDIYLWNLGTSERR